MMMFMKMIIKTLLTDQLVDIREIYFIFQYFCHWVEVLFFVI